jgi:hypothetical protein
MGLLQVQGTNRYSLLQLWEDGSESTGGDGPNGAGAVDYSPWGAVYVGRRETGIGVQAGSAAAAATPTFAAAAGWAELSRAAVRWQAGELLGAGLGQSNVGGSRTGSVVQDLYAQLGDELHLQSCFTGDTAVLAPGGNKRIDQIKAGDHVRSRHEDEPHGAVEAKIVEEVFIRLGRVLNLHVGGRICAPQRSIRSMWKASAGRRQPPTT